MTTTTTDRIITLIRRTWKRVEVEGLEVTPDSDLRDDLGFDDLDCAELMSEAEIAARCELLPDDAVDAIRTVRDLANAIDAQPKLKARPA